MVTITIRGWHGYLSAKKAELMNVIAKEITPNFEWEYEGDIGSFSQQWKLPFLAYPFYKDENKNYVRRIHSDKPNPTYWTIYITDYPNFQTR